MRGRKRSSQSEENKKSGGTGEEIVESEGLGDKKEEEDGEEEEEDDYDYDDDEEEEEEEKENGEKKEEENGEKKEEERTKLDDGFFEIEAIRRKRVRKGQLQYLIKWRGWPETENTWEPLENLQSCSDVIDVFEESLRSGKHSRKRKRKSSGPHTQSKKKQFGSSVATYSATGLELSVVEKSPLVCLDNPGVVNLSASSTVTVSAAREGERNGNGNNVRKAKRVKDYSSANGSKKIIETKDGNDYDTKLSELKGALSSKGVYADKVAIWFQEGKGSEGDGPVNGIPKADCGEAVPSDRRTGAKRRKSGSVKRFKQDPASSGPNLTQNAVHVGYAVADEDMEIVNLGLTEDGFNHSSVDNSVNVPVITKLLKPVGFSASVSDNNQDASVTFLALRSDGKEVIVDNQYLKANNPLLLIKFYEQHLKYIPPA